MNAGNLQSNRTLDNMQIGRQSARQFFEASNVKSGLLSRAVELEKPPEGARGERARGAVFEGLSLNRNKLSLFQKFKMWLGGPQRSQCLKAFKLHATACILADLESKVDGKSDVEIRSLVGEKLSQLSGMTQSERSNIVEEVEASALSFLYDKANPGSNQMKEKLASYAADMSLGLNEGQMSVLIETVIREQNLNPEMSDTQLEGEFRDHVYRTAIKLDFISEDA